jgi:hypothetical protein
MYLALFRILPGPLWAKILAMIGIFGVTIFLLMAYVFPFIADVFLVESSTLDTP